MTIHVPTIISQNITYIAQYYLTVDSPYTNPIGEGWHDSGSKANFKVESQSATSSGNQYSFVSWTDIGDGSYAGSSNPQSVIMNNAITETANWEQASRLNSVLLVVLIILAVVLHIDNACLAQKKEKETRS